MAKLRNGLLGKSSGKVGGIVTANWKGVNYAREYVIPANPQSTAQTTRRSVFRNLIFLGRQIKTTFISTYWDNLFRGKPTTGFAQFTGYNQKQITSTTDMEDLKMATGDLESVGDFEVNPNVGANGVMCSWSKAIVSTGNDKDKIYAYAYVPERQFLYTQASSATRDDTEVLVDIPGLADVKYPYFIYVTVSNADGSNFSTTQGVKITPA